LRGYVRGTSGAFLWVNNGDFTYNHLDFHIETFGVAGIIVQVDAAQQFGYNTGAIHSASVEAVFSQNATANVVGNAVNVIGSVVQDSAGVDLFLGDQIPSLITTQLSKRAIINSYPLPTVAQTNANSPAFSAYRATTNQSITSNVQTKVALNAKDFDTHGYFDSTTNYRFTPKLSGYYQINAAYAATTIIARNATVSIYKNGAVYKSAVFVDVNGAAMITSGGSIACTVYLNGTTDYIEMYIYIFDNGGAPSIKFGTAATWMNGILVAKA
jgi:hypothetical protein